MTELERAARRYVRAYRDVNGAVRSTLFDAISERDVALHALIVAVGERCDCDPDTCPDHAAVERA